MRVVGLAETKLFYNLHNTGFPIIAELFKLPRLSQAVVSFSDKFKIKMKPFLSKQNCTALNFQPRSALQNFCKCCQTPCASFSPFCDHHSKVHNHDRFQHRRAYRTKDAAQKRVKSKDATQGTAALQVPSCSTR